MRFTLHFLFFTLLSYTCHAQLTFSEDVNNNFLGVSEGEQRLADFDNDGDLDLLFIGYAEQFSAEARLFLNDGNGIFSETSSIIEGVGYAAMDIADIDGDQDIDILIAGQHSTGVSTQLYLNNGNATFSMDESNDFPAMMNGIVDFADIDGDGDQDFLMAGTNATLSEAITRIYSNDGFGVFSLTENDEITKVYQGSSDFADIDGDQDVDLILTGTHGSLFNSYTALYVNNGSGKYSLMENTNLIDVNISSTDFADIDNDGDYDLLITGSSNFSLSSALYKNDGEGNFIPDNESDLVPIIFSDCALADFDNDGDIDLMMAGRKGPIPDETAQLYLNDGFGVFSLLENQSFIGATAGGIAVGDVNNDEKKDIIITGAAPDMEAYTKLYINNLMVSVAKTKWMKQALIQPNPCSDFIQIIDEDSRAIYELEIINNIGQRVYYQQEIPATDVRISTTAFNPGIYHISWLLEDNQRKTKTFIKQ